MLLLGCFSPPVALDEVYLAERATYSLGFCTVIVCFSEKKGGKKKIKVTKKKKKKKKDDLVVLISTLRIYGEKKKKERKNRKEKKNRPFYTIVEGAMQEGEGES